MPDTSVLHLSGKTLSALMNLLQDLDLCFRAVYNKFQPNSIKTPWYKERSNFPCINSSGCCWRYNAVILTTFRPIWTNLNTTAYLSIVTDHVNPFMTTVHLFTSRRITHHVTKLISKWFLEHDNRFTVLKWPQQSNQCSILWWKG